MHEAVHSIACITDADHSIAFNKTVMRGCVVARRDGRAGPSRCATTTATRRRSTAVSSRRYALRDPVTVTFKLIFIGGRDIVMDYTCAKFGDFDLSRFGFIVLTDTQTDRITDTDDRYIDATTVAVRNYQT